MTHELLIVGDFRAREHTPRAAPEPLAHRSTRRVDRDDLDEALAAMSPELTLRIAGIAGEQTIRFAALDDFHPDRLAERVPALQQLRELRATLAAPGRLAPTRQPAPAVSRDAAAAAMSSGSLLDRMLDDAREDAGAVAARSALPPDDLSDFVRRAVQAHIVSESTPAQRDQLAKVDDAIAATLRVILHHPSFQALESLWRGLDFLSRRVDTGESVRLSLVDVTRSEIDAALSPESGASAGGLRSLLEAPSSNRPGSRWSLVVAAHTFGANDVALLERLANLARDAGVPWIAGAHPSLGGAASFARGGDADDWRSEPAADWDALRSSDAAQWLGLALPRFLLRVPYGAAGEPCELVPFEEVESDRPAHDGFLWGNPALLCATILGQSLADDGSWATQGTVDRLPFHVARVDGEAAAIPCAEALLSQRSITHLLDRGLIALASERDRDAIRVARLQSIARPPSRLRFAPEARDS
jgi:type VI secretion system protein ImpC